MLIYIIAQSISSDIRSILRADRNRKIQVPMICTELWKPEWHASRSNPKGAKRRQASKAVLPLICNNPFAPNGLSAELADFMCSQLWLHSDVRRIP